MKTPVFPAAISIAPAAALYAMRRDPLAFFTKMAREQGDVVEFRLGEHERVLASIDNPAQSS
jgi:hypothetical protein